MDASAKAGVSRCVSALVVNTLLFGAIGTAGAQTPPPGGLGDVVVTATRHATPAMEMPASASVVEAAELARRAPTRFGDALADVPSVYVRGSAMGGAFPSSGTSVMSIRGVPRTVRTLVLIDGMPINNALSGGVNVAGLPLEDIVRVETVRGPYSALYGGNAMGGVVNFITAGADQPIAELRVGAGDFGTRSVHGVLRRRFADGLGLSASWSHRSSTGYDDSDWAVKTASSGAATPGVTGAVPTLQRNGAPAYLVGYRGRRPWSASQMGVKLDAKTGPNTTIETGVAIAGYRLKYAPPASLLRDAAGQVLLAGNVGVGAGSRVVVSESDFLTPTPSSERDLRWFGRLEHRFAAGVRLTVNASMLDHAFSFPLADRGASGYESGPGQWINQPNQRYDVDASLRFALGPHWFMTTGIALSRGKLDRSTLDTANWRSEATATGQRNRAEGVIDGRALFAQAEWFVDDRTTLYFGGRFDHYETSGRVQQANAPAFVSDYPSRSFSEFSPKVAVSHRISRGLSLRASLGTGFRPPALLDLYSRVVSPSALAGGQSVNEASPGLGPERIRAIELGADGQGASGLRWSATVFRQTLTDLIYRRRLSPTLTQTQNAGEALVEGVEASLRWRPFSGAGSGVPGQSGALARFAAGLSVFASGSYLFRYEITRNDAVPASVGKRLTDVAQSIYSLGLEYERGPLSGFVAYRYTSSVFGSGDDQNTDTTQGVYGAYDAHGTIDARIAYRLGKHLRGALSVRNLTDRRYFEFYRQPGRSLFAEVALGF